jgi:hypothetical protein
MGSLFFFLISYKRTSFPAELISRRVCHVLVNTYMLQCHRTGKSGRPQRFVLLCYNILCLDIGRGVHLPSAEAENPEEKRTDSPSVVARISGQ